MTTSKIWAAAALGAGLLLAGAANAQDYFQQRGDRASQDETVALRMTLPLGGKAGDRDAAPRLALSFSQGDAEGALRATDLATLRFDGGKSRIDTPYRANLGGGLGGWIASHPVIAIVGAGLIVWGVVEATQDDETPTNGCGQNSRC